MCLEAWGTQNTARLAEGTDEMRDKRMSASLDISEFRNSKKQNEMYRKEEAIQTQGSRPHASRPRPYVCVQPGVSSPAR